MTERFKNAVKNYVADCVLTEAEKSDLMRIATEDNINETDAIIYMNSELKKRISRKQTVEDIGDFLKETGKVIVGIATVVGGILGGLAALKNAETERKKIKK